MVMHSIISSRFGVTQRNATAALGGWPRRAVGAFYPQQEK
jgi:hypothetical protein